MDFSLSKMELALSEGLLCMVLTPSFSVSGSLELVSSMTLSTAELEMTKFSADAESRELEFVLAAIFFC